MQFTVLTSSKSKGISSGLSYTSDRDLDIGSAVSVPLRDKVVEGVILAKEAKKKLNYELKPITSKHGLLLSEAQIQTLKWMSKYYYCSLRQCLSVWLPSISWQKLLDYDRIDLSDIDLVLPKLTQDQQAAYESISTSSKPTLLYGVTGSGKTAVYFQLIKDVLGQGKQAIYLLPEILLTEEFVHRFLEVFPEEIITVWHSRMTPAQKRNAWQSVHSGQVRVVIGSRSALFAPCRDLGLVIVDEEHEWTYKSERAPRYHVRKTAEKLCEFSQAKLVLGSATPSLETWHRARVSNQYSFAELSKRYLDAPMPKVKIVDLAHAKCGAHYPLSPLLVSSIKDCLDRGKQSVLFLNRRGSASAMLCLSCRRRIVSSGSNLPYTVHKRLGKPYLLDHTTGEVCDVPSVCPSCLSPELKPVGAGTHKIEELLEDYFPSARILRADKDTLKHPEHMKLLLKKMREGQGDILLGTQSVVKGLDLPRVTLAAVLVADIGMSLPHFRASERSFQLLSQLTGRSGRRIPGEVIIQTYRPDALEVVSAANHDTTEFLNLELRLRNKFGYPPYGSILRLLTKEEHTARETKSQIQSLDKDLQVTISPRIFVPNEWQVLVRGSNPESVLSKIDLEDVVIDRDPIECV